MDSSFIVDSHAHLDMKPFDADREQVIARAHEKGVRLIVNIGIDLQSSRESVKLTERYEGVFATVGVHPHEADKLTEAALIELGQLLERPRVVAVGETGLDFYRNLSPREKQVEAFQKQLALAQSHDKPVVVHSRDASRETYDILSAWARPAGRPIGVLHCFSGDVRLAWKYVEMGFLISISGTVTRSSQAAEVARELPMDKLLVETDSPFLTPQPIKDRRNQPAYITTTVEKIAQVRGISSEAVARRTAQNAISLFNLGVPVPCP
ncbi:MAG: TatD family hydrolase [Dehalococcoidia bacterium]|nr:TatD family hydrolase [Dehalococcoidia bacterium]